MLKAIASESDAALDRAIERLAPHLAVEEVGATLSIGRGIARVSGLPHVQAEEVVRFSGPLNSSRAILGLAFNLDADEIGIIVLGDHEDLTAGTQVQRCGRVLDIPVGEGLLGRVVDSTGRPLDGKGRISTTDRHSLDIEAPAIMDRAPVTTPLQTGIKAIDALIPIGRGQRELILGDRQTGKTAIAIDTIINQRDTGVICIYCAIGQRNAAVAGVIRDLRDNDALGHSIVVAASCEDAPGLQYIAPYAATTLAEFFMKQGRDVLVVYDDLTKHARAYRELSLLLRRPPGREAYPGDIFYVHSRLLERSTHLREEHGGGSLTALPVIETEAQNISAYIPTNLISITDGQIYLSPDLFRKGQLPAVNVGKSVSRVGGKAQLPAYRAVAGDLRLSYSQFEELERFSRFGTRLDKETRETLAHGHRVREILKQDQYCPIPVTEQIAALFAVSEGVLDGVPLEAIRGIEERIANTTREEHADLQDRVSAGNELSEEDRETLAKVARAAVKESNHADPTGHEEAD